MDCEVFESGCFGLGGVGVRELEGVDVVVVGFGAIVSGGASALRSHRDCRGGSGGDDDGLFTWVGSRFSAKTRTSGVLTLFGRCSEISFRIEACFLMFLP